MFIYAMQTWKDAKKWAPQHQAPLNALVILFASFSFLWKKKLKKQKLV